MRLLAIAMGVSLVVSAPAFADCPVNHIITGGDGHGLQNDSTNPENSYEGTPVVPGGPCVACYSWPNGYFRVSGNSPTDWGAAVNATDHFQISGPSSVTPLSITARLRFTGSVSIYASGSVGLGDLAGASNSVGVSGGQSPSNQILVLPLEHLPNEPFDLVVDLSVGASYPYAAADLQAYLEFLDVPSGWSIVSCQGYDVPVPARAQTWGSVKATYR
jgi:hypothetical protein